jgi:HK97 family phage prohead protease
MKRLNAKQWRASEKKSDALLLKAMDTEVTASEDARVLNFVISTETVDSYNDVVKADGWDLERYLKNPVVLWAHDSRQPPVAKALTIGVNDKKLVSSAEFADADTYAFADTIYRLLRGKFLRATSVGFFPREWTYDEERGGFNLIKNELFEFSIVPVPANPDALGAAAKSGIDCAPLKEWAEKTLDLWEPKGDHDRPEVAIWIPKSQIESVYASLSKEAVSVPGDVSEAASDGVEAQEDGSTRISIELDEVAVEDEVVAEA